MEPMARPRVIVFGSIHADITLRVSRIPVVGETIIADELRQSSGGKGANQAYAAARTGRGVPVLMGGAVGDDEPGARMRDELTAAGVDVTLIRTVGGPSGTAMIAVDDEGGNIIVVAPGARHVWPEPPEVPVRAGDVLVLQLELPPDVVEHVARQGRAAGARVVLNAAPVTPGARDLLALVDCLIVNEPEAAELLGWSADAADTGAAGIDLVVTRGAQGATVVRRDGTRTDVPAVRADAIDTVGAGDAFVGTFAAALAGGADVITAARRGSAAGALTVAVAGARHPQLSAELVDDALTRD